MNRQPLTIVGLVCVLGVALTGCDGWNSVTEGENGLVQFTPTDCGRKSFCDLDDDIASGSTLRVHIDEASDDISVLGYDLVSSNPYVFDVVPVDGRSNEWQILANNPGTADLIAVDIFGIEVDYTYVYVAAPTSVNVSATRGVRKHERNSLGFDRVYWVTAGNDASFTLRPHQLGIELMGELRYDVVVDEALAAALLPGTDIAGGSFAMNAPAGEYTASFIAPTGARTDILIIAE